MTKHFPLFVVMVFVLFGFTAFPGRGSACATAQTAVFFINGIGNTYEQAEESRFWLEERVLNRGVDPSCVSFDIAYNHNEPLFLDWVEAWQQKMADVEDFMVTFWLFLGRVAGASDEFLTTVYNAVTLIDPPVYLIDPDLDEHLASYRSEIALGRSVIAVPHSQGNFYANKAWEKLTPHERASFHLVAAASPAFIVADGGPYTTLDEDKLIAAIPLSLPSNLTNGPDFPCEDDWKCHGFKETYLASTTASEDKIVEDILALLVVPLPPPPEEFAELRGTVTYQIAPEDPILPAVGARAELTRVFDDGHPELFGEVLTDELGRYAFADMPPDRYVLFVSFHDVSLLFSYFSAKILEEPIVYEDNVHFGPLSPEARECLPLCP